LGLCFLFLPTGAGYVAVLDASCLRYCWRILSAKPPLSRGCDGFLIFQLSARRDIRYPLSFSGMPVGMALLLRPKSGFFFFCAFRPRSPHCSLLLLFLSSRPAGFFATSLDFCKDPVLVDPPLISSPEEYFAIFLLVNSCDQPSGLITSRPS